MVWEVLLQEEVEEPVGSERDIGLVFEHIIGPSNTANYWNRPSHTAKLRFLMSVIRDFVDSGFEKESIG